MLPPDPNKRKEFFNFINRAVALKEQEDKVKEQTKEDLINFPEDSPQYLKIQGLINLRQEELNELIEERDDKFGGGGIDITRSPSTKKPYKYKLPTPD